MDMLKTTEGKQMEPKKRFRFTDKQLLIFIIVGAILCIILGYIIVRMCTATPGPTIDDWQTHRAANLVIDHIRCRPMHFVRF